MTALFKIAGSLFFAKTFRTVPASHMVCVRITDNRWLLLYNQNAMVGLWYLLPKIMQIARKRTL